MWNNDELKAIVLLNCGTIENPKPLSRVKHSIKIWKSLVDGHIRDSKNTIGNLDEKKRFRECLQELIRQARIIEESFTEQLQLL